MEPHQPGASARDLLPRASTEVTLAPGTTLRAEAGRVVLRRGERELVVGAGWERLLAELATPRTLDDALRLSGVPQVLRAQAEPVVRELIARGFLVAARERTLEDLLAPPLRRPEVLEAIGARLRAGRLVVIPNAFDAELAERVHQGLEASDRWQPYEGTTGFFHFRHHNLYDPADWPPALLECRAHLESRGTRELVAGLSGADCGGPFRISASLYLPGDHSLPHSDRMQGRTVAFIWHLTRAWSPAWGGALFWCRSGTYVAPSFNTLHLFNVAQDSLHFVTTVSPHATGKRLAVNGWWCGATAEAPVHEPPASASVAVSRPAEYGPPRERLSDPEILVF